MTRAHVEWVDDGHGRLPVFFSEQNRLVDALHDFIASAAEVKRPRSSTTAYASTVDAATYALLGWLRYLEHCRLDLWAVRDSVVKGFRDTNFTSVLASPKGKGDEDAAMRSVNIKLEWVYRFYAWAQSAALCDGLVGSEGPLKSALLETRDDSVEGKAPSRSKLFPQCFDIGRRANGPQHFATPSEKRRMLDLIARQTNPYLRERDHLIVELADRVGWRSGTLTGLRVADFDPGRYDPDGESDFQVRPSVQKHGRGFSFSVPSTLAARVIRFAKLRSTWLLDSGFSEKEAKGMLFLNARNGKPLKSRRISQRVGQYYRQIGVPAGRGANIHSFRRKYSSESTRDDVEARRQLGLSTAAEDVLHANALRMGHQRIASQAPYQRAIRDSTHSSEVKVLRRRLQDAEANAADKEKLVQELRRKVDELEALAPKRVPRAKRKGISRR